MRLSMQVLSLVMLSLFLGGCRSFCNYYGRDNALELSRDLGCIQEYGVSCEEVNAEDERIRAAVQRAIKRADNTRRIQNGK